jgi:hypothetical protein
MKVDLIYWVLSKELSSSRAFVSELGVVNRIQSPVERPSSLTLGQAMWLRQTALDDRGV